MIQYISKKITYSLLVLLGVVLTVFLLFNVLPGDPARLTLGQRADVASIEAVKHDLGLDKSLPEQFVLYLNDLSPLSVHYLTKDNQEKYNYQKLVSKGKWGLVIKYPYLRKSYQTRKKVSKILLEALPSTLLLAFTAILFSTIIGVILGVLAAIRKDTWVDSLVVSLSVTGTSLPAFFSAIILSFLFGHVLSEYTGLRMTGGLYDLDTFDGEVLALQNLILPTVALGVRPLAIIVQLTRSSMLDVLSQDYIRTAVSKGVSRRTVIYYHGLRNALNPIVTAISGLLASLMAGAFFVEWVFNWKGIGKASVDALIHYDFPVVMGAVLITSTTFVLMNIFVDVLYGVLDPRVSLKN